MTLTYSVGLRVSEIVNLKINDIDSKRMLIHIRKSKGRKDRIVPLSQHVLDKATAILKKMVENAKLVGNMDEVFILEAYLPNQLST